MGIVCPKKLKTGRVNSGQRVKMFLPQRLSFNQWAYSVDASSIEGEREKKILRSIGSGEEKKGQRKLQKGPAARKKCHKVKIQESLQDIFNDEVLSANYE